MKSFQRFHSTSDGGPKRTPTPNLQPRQLRRIPPAAENLNQQNTGIHSPPLHFDIIGVLRQKPRLRGNDLQIVINPADISIRKQLQRIRSRCRGLLLLQRFSLQNPQRRGCPLLPGRHSRCLPVRTTVPS